MNLIEQLAPMMKGVGFATMVSLLPFVLCNLPSKSKNRNLDGDLLNQHILWNHHRVDCFLLHRFVHCTTRAPMAILRWARFES